jgi:hypothetical protein
MKENFKCHTGSTIGDFKPAEKLHSITKKQALKLAFQCAKQNGVVMPESLVKIIRGSED